MKKTNSKKEAIKSAVKSITIRLDERTVITLKSMDAFAFWKEKYPKARVIAA